MLPSSVLFAAGQCADRTFLGLVPWYHYLKLDKNCEIPNFTLLGSHSDILLIILAVIDDLLRIAGVVAVVFVIYAGFRYVTSQGSPEETSKAQSTIINALIGLAIALIAVGVVSYIGNKLGGGRVGGGHPGHSLDVSSLPNPSVSTTKSSTVKTALTIAFGVLGALSLLFITIGGLRYVISQGDSQATSKAKSTIIYALVGLAVAITAQAIVTFVIGKIT
ncbi:MAG TPA: hypothetical protein VFL85_03585 [Candidatus Saccharimonadales bacterium]|nr:hypothetical protein [Candidatus Saccharimonadales bacterium]